MTHVSPRSTRNRKARRAILPLAYAMRETFRDDCDVITSHLETMLYGDTTLPRIKRTSGGWR